MMIGPGMLGPQAIGAVEDSQGTVDLPRALAAIASARTRSSS